MGKATGATPPTPPDPATTATAQTGSNVNTAIANSLLANTNQRTPTGSLTYNKIGEETVDGHQIPRYEAITQLSPEQQALYNSQIGAATGASNLANQYVKRIGDATAQPFSYDGMPAAPQYDENARVAARDRIIARDQPNQDRDRAQLESRLANQGIAAGSEAWGNGMGDYNRSVNDYRLGADKAAGGEAAQMFALQGDARTRAIQEATNLRTQPINEVSALLGTGPGVQAPSFVNTPVSPVAGTDVAGIYGQDYANRLMQYQIAQGGSNSMLGGLFGLGGAGLGGWALSGFGGLGGGGFKKPGGP